MAKKRSSEKYPMSAGTEAAIKQSSSIAAAAVAQSSGTAFDPSSAEAKARRAKLIADLNAGWSEDSERALSSVAERFFGRKQSN